MAHLFTGLPPPSIDLEASSVTSHSLDCSYEFGRCTYKESPSSQDIHATGRRLEQGTISPYAPPWVIHESHSWAVTE